MKNQVFLRKTLVSLFPLFFTIWPTYSYADNYLASKNSQFSYMGRIDFNATKGAYLSWPGSSVSFRFTGKQLFLDLEDDSGSNYYNVIFNNEDQFPYVLKANKGRHRYDLSHKIRTTETQVTLFKRTDGSEGGSYFKGIALSDEGKLLAPPTKPPLRMLFYGDSVTVGVGNEAAHNAGDGNPEETNHYLSYAAITARNLNAEFHTIAKSGIGFMISWFDFIMPEYFDQLTAESNNDSVWRFSDWQPHIVVVNLGQNDKWLIEDEKQFSASPQEIILAYQNFIQSLRSHHPSAYFICALGSMDVATSTAWQGYIKTAIENIKRLATQNGNDANIDTIVFEFTGYGAHPRVDQHYQNANALTDFIRNKLRL